jgi:hypothetical protein
MEGDNVGGGRGCGTDAGGDVGRRGGRGRGRGTWEGTWDGTSSKGVRHSVVEHEQVFSTEPNTSLMQCLPTACTTIESRYASLFIFGIDVDVHKNIWEYANTM